MKKSVLYSIIAVAVAAILIVIVAIGSSGFRNWNFSTWFHGKKQDTVQPIDSENKVEPEPIQYSGGMLVSGGDGNGMGLLNAKLPLAAYAANGISTQADSAYLLTVTVYPDTATNTAIDWSVSWVNAQSGFASGKAVSDYVVVTPTADGALTASITCKQPFGAQIKVNVISRDNPDATAQCLLDYAQRVQSAGLKLGDFPIDLGGDTYFKAEINENGVGVGGKPVIDYVKASAYTVEDNFTYVLQQVNALPGETLVLNGHNFAGFGVPVLTNLNDFEFIFDRAHLIGKCFYMDRKGDVYLRDCTTSELITYFSNIESGHFGRYTLTFTGTYSSYETSFRLICNGYTNIARVTGLEFSDPTVIL